MAKAISSVGHIVTGITKPFSKLLMAGMPKPTDPTGGASTQTIRSAAEAEHYIYGRTATGGLLAYMQEDEHSHAATELLHAVYVIAGHPIEAVDQILVNKEDVLTFGKLVSYQVHINPTEADPFLLKNGPDWKDDMIGRELTYVRMTFQKDQDKFPDLPEVMFIVRGSNEIFDPRTGTTGYSDNAALCLRHYLKTRLGAADEEIIDQMFINAANVCDEQVSVPGGGTEARYRACGVIKADDAKTKALQGFEDAMGGHLIRIGGKFGAIAGAYYGPAGFTVTEDMVVGQVTGQVEPSSDDSKNSIAGKWYDPAQQFVETSYPTVRVEEWVQADGQVDEDSLDLPMVPSSYQCQRLANIRLRSNRSAGPFTLPLNFKGYACRPGQVIKINLPKLNIEGEFRVTDWKFGLQDGCQITVRAEDAAIYDDAVGQPYDPIQVISLPTGGMSPPTGLRYDVEQVGEVLQGYITWNAVAGAVDYSVTVFSGKSAVQATVVPAPNTRMSIGGLKAGRYNVEVVARGSVRHSQPASINISINVPPLPDSVNVDAGNNELTLTPILRNDTLNGGTWEYWFSTQPNLSNNEIEAKATYLSRGASFTHIGLQTKTTYFYWIRGINAYGTGDWYHLAAATIQDVGAIMSVISGEIKEGDLYKGLQTKIDLIDGTGPGSVNQRVKDAADQAEKIANEANTAAGQAQKSADQAEKDAKAAQTNLDAAKKTLASDITKAQSTADAAQAAASQAQSNLDAARKKLDSDIAKAQAAADAAQDDASQAQSDLDTAKQQLGDEIAKAQASADKAQQDVQKAYDTLGSDIDSTNKAVSEAQASADKAQQDAQAASDKIDSSVSDLTKRVDANKNAVTSLTRTVNNNNSSTNKRIDGLNSTVTQNKADIASETKTRADADTALGQRVDAVTTTAGNNSSAITAEQQARADGDKANADAINQVKASVSSNTGAITTEQKTRADADKALGQRVDSVTATAKSNSSAITAEQKARADGDQANANAIAQVKATVASNTGAITSEQKARADADKALGQRIDTVTATTNGNKSAIVSEQKARTDADKALGNRITSVAASFGSGYNAVPNPAFANNCAGWVPYGGVEASFRADSKGAAAYLTNLDGDNWRGFGSPLFAAQENVEFTASIDVYLDGSDSQMRLEIPGYQNPDGSGDRLYGPAVDKKIPRHSWTTITLQGSMPAKTAVARLQLSFTHFTDVSFIITRNWQLELNGPATAAAIDSESRARTNADSALGQRIDAVTATAKGNQAAITSESKARADGDKALGQRVDSVTATAKSNSSAITAEQKARADGDKANANAIAQVKATVASNTGAITSEEKARADADKALGQRVDTVTATANGNKSAITSEQKARSDADKALSDRITSVSASFGSGYNAVHDSSYRYGTTAYSTWYDKLSMDKDTNGQSVLVVANQNGRYMTAIADKIYATPGRPYTFTADVYIADGTASQLQLQPDYFHDMDESGRDSFDASGMVDVPVKKWVTLTYSGTIPDGMGCVQPKIISAANEKNIKTLWVKNWQFEFAGPATASAIDSESRARANADSALSQRIDTVTATAKGNQAAITGESKARADGDKALGQRVDSVTATAKSNASAITAEQKARADGDKANANAIAQVKATMVSNTGAITSEQKARADADKALGQRIDTVTATSNGNKAAINSEQKARTDADKALGDRITSVTASFGSGYNVIPNPGFDSNCAGWKTYGGAHVAFRNDSHGAAALLTNLPSKGWAGLNSGRFSAPENTNYTATFQVYVEKAIKIRIEMYQFKLKGDAQQVTSHASDADIKANTWTTLTLMGKTAAQVGYAEIWLSVSSVGDVGNFITRDWQCEFNGPATTGAITSESKARADGDKALGQRVDSVTATAKSNSSAITAEQKARADGDQANANAIAQVKATMASNTGAITSEQRARADADKALGQRIDTVTATTNGNKSAIVSEQKARTDADKALGNRITSVAASFGSGYNAVPNPAFGNNCAGWVPYGGVKASFRADSKGAAAYLTNLDGDNWRGFGSPLFTAQENVEFTASIDVYLDGPDSQMRLEIPGYQNPDGSGDRLYGPAVDKKIPRHSWTTVTLQGSMPAKTAVARLQLSFKNFTDVNFIITRNWQLELNGPATAAAIDSESRARANADSALSQRIDTVTATAKGNRSAITSEQKSRADADKALGQRVDSVTATAKSNSSAITAEQKARADGDKANANTIAQVKSSVDRANSAITDERNTRTTAFNALSDKISSVQATTGGDGSNLVPNASLSADLDGFFYPQGGASIAITSYDNSRCIELNDDAGGGFNSNNFAIGAYDKLIISFDARVKRGSGPAIIRARIGLRNGDLSYNQYPITTPYSATPDDDQWHTWKADLDMSQLREFTTAYFNLYRSAVGSKGGSQDIFIRNISVVGRDGYGQEINASILDEQKARADADKALGQRIDTVTATTNGNKSAIVSEQKARTDADKALGNRITSVAASFGSGYNAVPNPAFANNCAGWVPYGGVKASFRADSKGAAAYLTNLDGDNWRGFGSPLFTAQENVEFTASIDVYLDGPDSQMRLEIPGYQNPDGSGDRLYGPAVDKKIPRHSWTTITLQGSMPAKTAVARLQLSFTHFTDVSFIITRNWQLELNGPATAAAIDSESPARSDADSALGQRIDTVTATAKGNRSAITSEQKSRADADKALGQRIDTVSAQAKDNQAAISREASARADGDKANAEAVDQLRSSVNNNTAAIQTVSNTQASQNKALSERIDTVQAQATADSNLVPDADFTKNQWWGPSIVFDSDGLNVRAVNDSSQPYVQSWKFPVSPGLLYFYSCQVKPQSQISNNFYINLEFFDKEGNSIGWGVEGNTVVSNVWDWTTLSSSVKAPGNAVQARLQVGDRNGGVWFHLRNPRSVLASSAESTDSVVSVQQYLSAQVGQDGTKAGATLKLDVNGHIMGYGAYNDGKTSQFIVNADIFAIAKPGDKGSGILPFIIQNGTTYLNKAMIANGTIGRAQITDYIQSDSYYYNNSNDWGNGLMLDFKNGKLYASGDVHIRGRIEATDGEFSGIVKAAQVEAATFARGAFRFDCGGGRTSGSTATVHINYGGKKTYDFTDEASEFFVSPDYGSGFNPRRVTHNNCQIEIVWGIAGMSDDTLTANLQYRYKNRDWQTVNSVSIGTQNQTFRGGATIFQPGDWNWGELHFRIQTTSTDDSEVYNYYMLARVDNTL